jgi:chemotaxis family two-component system sensor kinase Cph1
LVYNASSATEILLIIIRVRGSNFMLKVNLNNCDREPIHVPGSIQPHAIFIALREPDLLIAQVSDNIKKYFNQTSENLITKKLSDLLGDKQTNVLRKKLSEAEKSSTLKELNPLICKLALPSGEQLFDLTLHRTDGLLILEMEPCIPRQETYINNFFEQSRKAIERLQDATNSEELFEIIVQEVKKLTGFARVMAYQFDDQGHGSVIAESKENSLEPFLGLHYPASDIPKQARALYLRNWLRLIPDISATPSYLVPELNHITGRKLDLTFAVSRSVSPIHIQYLQNMGVQASMSISLIINDKLWGLIACHHSSPKFLPYEIRNVCEFLGQIFSWKIMQNITQVNQETLIQRKDLCNTLLQSMSISESWLQGLLLEPSHLLKLVNASGAVIYFNEEYHLVGNVPSLAKIKDLLSCYSINLEDKHIFTDSIATVYPDAESIKDKVCGVLLNPIVKENGSFIMWIRPELIQTISWAGDPNKSIVSDELGERLSPRGSFALWKEQVYLYSLPWTEVDQQICNEFKKYVLEIIVTHESKRVHLAEHLIQKQENFVDTICHEIRNPIHGILGSLDIIKGHLQETQIMFKENAGETVQTLLPFLDNQLMSIREYLANIGECANHQTVIANDVLNLSKLEAKKLVLEYVPMNLNKLIHASFKMLESKFIDKDIKFIFSDISEEVLCKNDIQRLRQVMVNLLSNAIKFTQKGSVTVTLSCVQTEVFEDAQQHVLTPRLSPHTRIAPKKVEELIKKNAAKDQLSLQQLLIIGNIQLVDSEYIKVIFNELQKAKLFVEKLLRIGIENINIPQEPRQIDAVLSHNSQVVYAVLLTTIELNALRQNKFEVKRKPSITQFDKPAKISLIKIDFEDTGIGMTLDEISKIFTRFSQANSAISATYGGSGLGLMISRELMTLMSGSIEVVSQKGHGAKFTLLLPYLALTFEEKIKLATEENKLTNDLLLSMPQLKPKTVLIVEDNVMNQKILKSMIGKKHQCEIANNGEEAITLFLAKSFDVIFMDINMAIMDGLVATQKIRQIEKETFRSPTLIIGLSGNAAQKYQESAIKVGMNEYLTKPYKKEAILAIINKLDELERLKEPFDDNKNSNINTPIPLRIYTKTPQYPQLLFKTASGELAETNSEIPPLVQNSDDIKIDNSVNKN